MNEILNIEGLCTYFSSGSEKGKAVDGLDLRINDGNVMGVVGESGSGKTVSAMSVLRLINPPGKIESGRILFRGEDLLLKDEEEMRRIRGNKIAMIFQEPMTSLNPVFSVGEQIIEALVLHQKMDRNTGRERAVKMLSTVGIPEPEKRVDYYPHQFSGGMRQRVMIGMALSCNPDLLIADEPTTALDVTIQSQILDLMIDLKNMGETRAIMFITHDLGVVAEICDYVTVMYCGKVMERTDVFSLFREPLHPYTIGLMKSLPKIGASRGNELYTIPGKVPDIFSLPKGCKFAERCPIAESLCFHEEPRLREIRKGHYVRCHKV